jgi:hypothetical protein
MLPVKTKAHRTLKPFREKIRLPRSWTEPFSVGKQIPILRTPFGSRTLAPVERARDRVQEC